jgi:hypothetical protein
VPTGALLPHRSGGSRSRSSLRDQQLLCVVVLLQLLHQLRLL